MAYKVEGDYSYEAWQKAQDTQKATAGTSLTMNDFYKLMAAELQNQDMSNPMDNAQMMNQMTQMAMMDAINTLSQTTVTTYAVSMVGKEGTFAVLDPATGALKGSITGIITSVDLSTNSYYLDGDMTKSYSLSQLMGVSEPGSVVNKPEGPGEGSGTDKPEGPDEGSGTDKPEGPDEGSGTDKPEGPGEGSGTDKPEGPGEGDGADKTE